MRIYWVMVFFWVPRLLLGQPEHALVGLLNTYPQANFLHPSYLPEGTVFVGVPVLSKVSFMSNHRFSFRDLCDESFPIPCDESRSPIPALRSRNNSSSLEGSVGLFLFGYKHLDEHYASFFINDRVSAFAYYPKNVAEFIWNKRDNIGREDIKYEDTEETIFSFDRVQVDALAYREIGFGYSLPLSKRLRVGMHLKYLTGLANLSVPGAPAFDIRVDENNYEHEIKFQNIRIRTANMPLDSALKWVQNDVDMDDYTFNNNRGVALDLGFSYDITPLWNISVSVRDVGFIRWKNKARRYRFEDDTLIVKGLRPEDQGIAKLKKIAEAEFTAIGTPIKYSTLLHYNMLSTLTWRLSRDRYLSFSHALQRTPDRFPGKIRVYYSLSYLQHLGRWSMATSIIRYPQQPHIGLGAVYNFGPFQLYGAVGNVFELLHWPSLRLANLNLGLNILTGRSFFRYNSKAQLCPTY